MFGREGRCPRTCTPLLRRNGAGQSGIAKKQSEVLDFFDERAVLRDTDQTRMTAGGGSEPPSELSAKSNVATEFRIKGDDRQDRFILAKYGQINPTRMIKHVLSSKFVSDEAKHALCTGRKATECVTWLQEFNERQRTRLEVAEGGTAITEAELASLTPAERKAKQTPWCCCSSGIRSSARSIDWRLKIMERNTPPISSPVITRVITLLRNYA